MDTGAISHNRRLERHSKHAARHPNNQYDFTQARPAHLEARDAALDQIIRDVEQSQEDQGVDFDLQRRLIPIGGGHDGGFDSGSDSGSNSGSHGGSGSNNGGGHSSQPPTSTVSKCINRGPDGVCVDGDQPRTSSTPRTTPSSTRTTSTTPTSTRSTSSSRSTSSTPSSTSSRTTSSSSSSTSIIPSSSSSTLLITTNGTTRTSVSFVTAPSAPESSSTTSSQDDGPGAGPIVGIVAGSLAGVAILSALIGFIWKKYSSSKKENEDEYENNPFGGGNDRDDFRRGSTMLQDDGFDEDGEFGGAPSMSEHGIRDGHGSYGAESVLAGAAGMGIAAGGAGMMARNESGAPRPPTMFARHLAQVNNNSAPPMPNAAEMYQGGNEGMYEDAYPQLPPMAFGSGGPPDPYSMNQNISNPYAHLDRAQQQGQGQEGYYSNLDRSGSQGSNSQGSHQQQQQQYPQQPGQFIHQDSFSSAKEDERDFDTSGRPGTAEGRSGTPDLPNMQQTYVMNGGIDGSSIGHHNNLNGNGIGSSGEVSNNNTTNGHLSREESQRSSKNGNNEDPFNENSPINSGKANVSHQLSVRNLMPNPHENQQAGGNRPLSTVSSVADPDDIYGGIY